MLTLHKIEDAARTARLASLYVKSVWIAALYTTGDVIATVTWSNPVDYAEPTKVASLPGITQEVWSAPSDSTLSLGRGSASEIEAEILSAAWALGAWDVRRMEYAPLADPAEWSATRHGVGRNFGVGGYVIMGQPLAMGESSTEAAQRAARDGYVLWQFVPLALCSPIMQARWRDKDRTLDAATCTRGARHIAPWSLYGKQEIGHAHDHIYELGRGNHGNRSKRDKSRRA